MCVCVCVCPGRTLSSRAEGLSERRIVLTGPRVSVGSSVRGVSLASRWQVAPLGVLLLLLQLLLLLLLVLRVAASTVVRRPAGVALRRVAQASGAGSHRAAGAHRVAAVVASDIASEMVKAGAGARPSSRRVHDWGRWRRKMRRAGVDEDSNLKR